MRPLYGAGNTQSQFGIFADCGKFCVISADATRLLPYWQPTFQKVSFQKIVRRNTARLCRCSKAETAFDQGMEQ